MRRFYNKAATLNKDIVDRNFSIARYKKKNPDAKYAEIARKYNVSVARIGQILYLFNMVKGAGSFYGEEIEDSINSGEATLKDWEECSAYYKYYYSKRHEVDWEIKNG